MLGVEAGEALLRLEDVLGVNEDIGRLPLESAERLVDMEAGVRQRRALARLAGHQEKRTHGPRGPDAQRANGRLDELHRVIHRKAARHDAAVGVDIEVDRLLRVVGLEEQQLSADERRHRVVDLAAEERRCAPEAGESRCRKTARRG